MRGLSATVRSSMIKVECVSCKSPYDVDERRIPAVGMKMRCPKCSTSFVIAKDGSVMAVDAQPSAANSISPPKAAAIPPPANAAGSAFAKPPAAQPQPGAASAFGAAKPAASAFGAPKPAASAFGAPPSKVAAPAPAAPAPPEPSPAKPAIALGPAAPPPGANMKQTLLGPAQVEPALPSVKSDFGSTVLGVSAPKAGAHPDADLPAVKPPPKPATPWGSLAPPGPESKAPPRSPIQNPSLPKGAMGVPSTPPLAASAMASKGVNASAFGGGSPKQTMVGHARNPAQELSPSSAKAIAPQPEPTQAEDLPFVDLPARKTPGAAAGNTNAGPGAKYSAAAAKYAEPAIDLPPRAAPTQAQSQTVDESTVPDIDLPAPKLANPAAKFKAPESPAIDLPAPKPDFKKTAFGAAVAPAAPVPAWQPKAAVPEPPAIDLPAPKPDPKKSAFGTAAAPAAPAPAAQPPKQATMEIDLPAPKHAAPKPPFAPPPKAPPLAPDLGMVDLPAPKASPQKPAFGAPPPPRAAAASSPDLELELEMPMVDLPAPKAPAARNPWGAPAGSDPDTIDLPQLKSSPSEPTFGEVDLPAPKGSIDLPAPKGSIDLPAPKGSIDLPVPKVAASPFGEVDLPTPKNIADLPAPRGIADLPAPRGVMDLPSPKAGFGELDLPIPKAYAGDGPEAEMNFGDLELPDGQRGRAKGGFGDIEFPSPRAGADLVPPKAATFQGVGIPRSRAGEDETSFGNLELGSPIPPYPDDEMRLDDLRPDDVLKLKGDPNAPMDLGSLPPALRGDDGGYGEAGLETGDESMEFGIAEGEGDAFALPPEILRRQRGEDAEITPAQKSRRAMHVLIGVALLLVVIGGAGAALGFTNYGFFGIYFLEQYLPEAANAKFAREAIERAEKSAAPDTYKGVRRSLTELGESRRNAGLNRELLTRSLMHEALYLVRFGTDTTSSARVAAIMRRLEERHGIAPGMALARAADAARKNEYREAESRLSEALGHTPNDPYAHLLAGEVSLRQGKLGDAEKSFKQALKHGGSARAQWGLARVSLARPDEALQRQAIDETLKLSPLHAEARIADARLLFREGKEERAVQELREALGLEAMDGQFLQTSKLAKAQGWSLLGHIHEQRGRLHLARKAYEDSLSADPYLVEALLGSGRVLLRERRFNDALARFESALNIAQKSPSSIVLTGRKADVESRLGQSRAELFLGRAPDAKANLTKLIAEHPNDPEITLALGQAEEALNNKESAETLFRKSIELAPDQFAGYLALSQFYFKQNQPDKASETLNDAAGKVAETSEMRRMLGQSELARNRLDSAIHEFKRAIELDAQDLDGKFGLAVSYRRAGELELARGLFDQIAERDPQYAGLTLERGQLLEAQGAYDKAVENYRAALEKDANDTAILLRLGAAQVESGQLDAAEETLDKVVHQVPNSADAAYYLGRIAFARGRGPDALSHFDRALGLDNTQASYHLYTARAALEMSNLGRTLDEAEATLARDPKSGDAYWVRGEVRLRSGAVKDALKDATRALELNPKRVEAHALMAECYDELRQLPQAVTAYQTALAGNPERGDWWYKLGRVYTDQGTRGAGFEALDKAIKLGNAIDPPPYWLADAYRLVGDLARASQNRKDAVTAYKRYLELAPQGALDRGEVLRVLRDWNVELDD